MHVKASRSQQARHFLPSCSLIEHLWSFVWVWALHGDLLVWCILVHCVLQGRTIRVNEAQPPSGGGGGGGFRGGRGGGGGGYGGGGYGGGDGGYGGESQLRLLHVSSRHIARQQCALEGCGVWAMHP